MKQRWFAYTVALLGLGMGLQLVVSYAISLSGASYGAKSWFTASTALALEASHASALSELGAAAERVAGDGAARGDSAEAIERVILEQFGSRRPKRPFWAIVAADGHVVSISDPRCAATIERRVRDAAWAGGAVVGCDGSAAITAYRALPGERWSGVALGWTIDGAYADFLSQFINTEIVLYSGGAQIGTSIVDESGAPLAMRVSQAALGEAASGKLAFRADGRVPAGYRGYAPGTHEFIPIDPSESWYYGAKRISTDEDVVLILAVPMSWMTLGANYSSKATAVISAVVLVVFGLLVRRLVHRFTAPVSALTRSARAVAAGDLTREVPVPPDPGMRELCDTYNGMLSAMRELLELRQRVAREAGMADIANGVLHNIGNVLNSVNVSVSLAKETVQRSRVKGVANLSKLVDAHRDDLPRFFGDDPRGKKVPEYLRTLSVELEREREQVERELASTAESVEHIKRIVSAQQRYVHVGLVERASLEQIVRDALRMSATSLRNHRIELACDVADVEIVVDRHKLLQIIVNLVTNAKQALAGVQGPKRIAVSAGPVEGDQVRLTVEDNGVGIAPEHQPHVFRQGFTTKAHGHGIGLHNSSIAAAEMGGRLSFVSEGVGRGCAFTLELPLVAPQRDARPSSSGAAAESAVVRRADAPRAFSADRTTASEASR